MATKIGHDHPLYLSTSDVPRTVQIGIQLTGMENYSLWSRVMTLTFLTKNKLGFIDGSLKRDDFETDLEKKQWDHCNVVVLSWLMNNVSKELVSAILFQSNAVLVWKDLKERFDKDLFTGRVKDIGEVIDGLYILRSHKHLESKEKRSFAATKGHGEVEI
ncbi:uncharacterized protein LOC129895962 [Solanum dulcamara]|uniref:uncharacterized protein LOC129895962 n=1 Tax=Solanum dulcamara TaxID=45834 RepID=UPI002484FEF7|nr:uncharacterized protein LOC129895962 [Solanum dulcamara]